MKRLLFFCLLILFSCNQRNYSILEAEISSLKNQNDSLTVALAESGEQVGKEKEFAIHQAARQQEELQKMQMITKQQQAEARVQRKIAEEARIISEKRLIYSEQQRMIAEEQQRIATVERNLAEKLKLEAETMRQKYDSLLIKYQK